MPVHYNKIFHTVNGKKIVSCEIRIKNGTLNFINFRLKTSVNMEEEIDHQDDLKMSAETDIDIVYLTETTDISKEESLKIFQSIVSFHCLKCLR